MFIGHLGIAFAAHAFSPRLPMSVCLLAALLPDLMWSALMLTGLESVRIVPGGSGMVPLVFDDYPFSHSLAMVGAWGVLTGCVYFALFREGRGTLILTGLVLSHWFLDALVHLPDLLLIPGGETRLGLGGWRTLPGAVGWELPWFIMGAWWYGRTSRARNGWGHGVWWGMLLLVGGIYVASLIGPPPPDPMAVAWGGQASWLIVWMGSVLDRHRMLPKKPEV